MALGHGGVFKYLEEIKNNPLPFSALDHRYSWMLFTLLRAAASSIQIITNLGYAYGPSAVVLVYAPISLRTGAGLIWLLHRPSNASESSGFNYVPFAQAEAECFASTFLPHSRPFKVIMIRHFSTNHTLCR
jgi:hypothetical protein